jgi:hypothetical protein
MLVFLLLLLWDVPERLKGAASWWNQSLHLIFSCSYYFKPLDDALYNT